MADERQGQGPGFDSGDRTGILPPIQSVINPNSGRESDSRKNVDSLRPKLTNDIRDREFEPFRRRGKGKRWNEPKPKRGSIRGPEWGGGSNPESLSFPASKSQL